MSRIPRSRDGIKYPIYDRRVCLCLPWCIQTKWSVSALWGWVIIWKKRYAIPSCSAYRFIAVWIEFVSQMKRAVVCDCSYPWIRQRSRLRDGYWKEWAAEQQNLMANSSSERKGKRAFKRCWCFVSLWNDHPSISKIHPLVIVNGVVIKALPKIISYAHDEVFRDRFGKLHCGIRRRRLWKTL